jgi:dinuclear metal center YbgI/SA1388 family protein
VASVSSLELTEYLNSYLSIDQYDDYGPNGLQVEGSERISKIAYAVSATIDSIQKAIEYQADALIVHHGLFWKFHGPRPITGPFAKRVRPLIENQINLLGYHLPLDGHQEVGNAVTLAQKLNLTTLAPFALSKTKAPLGCQGVFSSPVTAKEFTDQLIKLTGRQPLVSEVEGRKIRSIGIITGGANSHWREALNAGLDAYLTGEMSEHDWHEAREAGVHFFAAGHNATEQYGVQGLKEMIEKKWNIPGVFISSLNPA